MRALFFMDLREAAKKFRKNKKWDSWYGCVEAIYKEDKDYDSVKEFRRVAKAEIKSSPSEIMRLLRESYILTARDYLDDYMIAMEWDRQKKFYLPRRKALLPIVEGIQDLADDKLDILCASMPPGVGKSGVELFAVSWMGGRKPDEGILLSSHNADFLKGAYSEILREVSSDEYNWKEIFAGSRIVETNAKDMKIAIDVAQRFPTFQFTSIGAGNAGKVRAVQMLCCDDLIASIEEAMSKERLDAKWQAYSVDLKQRKQGDHCKELHIATCWSVHDIIGRIERLNEGNDRVRIIKIPIMDENGESNFDYGGSDGFTKEFIKNIQETMDEVSFRALSMGEPIEREGLLYTFDDIETAYELPEGEPDAILAVCDTAEGGGDNTVMPIFYVYGHKHYLWDVIDTDALPDIAQPLCAEALIRNKVNKVQFESNMAGGRFADCVEQLVKQKGGFTHVTKRRTTTNKETKIIVESGWVKENVVFKDRSIVDKKSMYWRFMNGLTSYTVAGKNKHDDEVDSVAMYSKFYRQTLGMTVTVLNRRDYLI